LSNAQIATLRRPRARGATPLSGADVKESGLQASASLVLAGVAAHGKTPINRVDHI